ncbi:MAG TPA: hypothetical protein P5040_02575 [Smithella sp.]|nr:hypothetical protein [Smithella sp.]
MAALFWRVCAPCLAWNEIFFLKAGNVMGGRPAAKKHSQGEYFLDIAGQTLYEFIKHPIVVLQSFSEQRGDLSSKIGGQA